MNYVVEGQPPCKNRDPARTSVLCACTKVRVTKSEFVTHAYCFKCGANKPMPEDDF